MGIDDGNTIARRFFVFRLWLWVGCFCNDSSGSLVEQSRIPASCGQTKATPLHQLHVVVGALLGRRRLVDSPRPQESAPDVAVFVLDRNPSRLLPKKGNKTKKDMGAPVSVFRGAPHERHVYREAPLVQTPRPGVAGVFFLSHLPQTPFSSWYDTCTASREISGCFSGE